MEGDERRATYGVSPVKEFFLAKRGSLESRERGREGDFRRLEVRRQERSEQDEERRAKDRIEGRPVKTVICTWSGTGKFKSSQELRVRDNAER
jgi:hypothetical protein